MPAGTIALTNNSATVTGTGTSFTTELKVNDFLVSTVGGVAYTLGVKSIESNTSLTLIEKYTGPTANGQSWTPVPYGTMAAITAQLAAQVTYAIRGLNLDKANWQQVFTGSGNITVTLPDGTSWQGPAWGGIATSISNKADKTALDSYLLKSDNLSSLTDKVAARTNLGLSDFATLSGAVPLNKGGTGATTKAEAWKALATYGNTAGTAAQGNDSRLDTVNGKTSGSLTGDALSVTRSLFSGNTYYGGIFSSNISVNSSLYSWCYFQYNNSTGGSHFINVVNSGNQWAWAFNQGGNAVASAGSWVNNSDERLKKNIKRIENPLLIMEGIKGVTWERLDNASPGIGFIAQDVQKYFPDNVFVTGDRVLEDGTEIKGILSPDTSGVAAALHHEAILALMEKIEKQDAVIAEQQKRMKAIDGLDA